MRDGRDEKNKEKKNKTTKKNKKRKIFNRDYSIASLCNEKVTMGLRDPFLMRNNGT